MLLLIEDKRYIRSFLVHSDTKYRPIEFPVSHLWQNLDQSVAFHATTLFTISWWPVDNFLLMKKIEVKNS